MKSRFKVKVKSVACVLFALFSAFSAEARKAYVETHWSGISAVSQTIKFMNGSAQVGSVTTSSKAATDTSNVATSVAPVYPTGGYSTSSKRSYGCKVKSALQPTDQVKVYNGGYRQWSDFPDSEYVEGWNGYQTKSSTRSDTVVYTTASDADPIFDVYNYKLSYSASGWSGPYDGNLHYISVWVGTSGCSVEYSSDKSSWSTSNVGHRDRGTYTVHYRIRKDGQTLVTGSETVTITMGVINYSASDVEAWYDGNSHSIDLSVSSPSGCAIEYSVNGTDGWTTAKPTFTDVGAYTTYFRISKDNYTTETGSRKVTIKALQDMAYSASGYTGTYDGNYHGISVSVTTPASGYTRRYSKSKDGTYSTSPITYRDVGTYTVWYQITATGYNTVEGSEQIVITPKIIGGPDDIQNPGYTNYTYTGSWPWGDTSWYTVHYGTNYWGWGWWWVEFRGYGNYTGTWTNWFYVAKKPVTITSGTKTREYTGSPLTYDYAYVSSGGFASGEGVESYTVTGSQTDVGYSPNDFTFKLKPNTDPRNYDITVVTGRLTVTSITPQSLRYPVRMEIVGTNRITVGVQETYRSRVTYSDGSYDYRSSNWTLAPNDGVVNRSFSGSYAYLKAYPDGAGSEHTLSASCANSYGTAAMVTNGLVAWYPFDGNTSDLGFYSQSMSRYNSSYATFANDRTGTGSRALRFSGSSSGYAYVSGPTYIAQLTNSLSISAWVKPENYSRLGLTYRNGQFSLRFRENGNWLFNNTTISCTKALMTNAWQLVTLTWDGATATAYLDGVNVGSAALSGKLGPGSGDFYLGRAAQGGSATEYFQGAVDDFRLFDRVLTADEISLIRSGTDVINASSSVSVSASKDITVEPHCSIPVAVDVKSATGSQIGSTAFSFTTGCTVTNTAGWFGQYAVNSGNHDDAFDYDAAQSGKFRGPGSSWMQTTTSGAGTLTFWWKTDCEATYDYLVFKDYDKELARLSGTNDWRKMTFDIPDGAHAFRWEYVKDGRNDVGADAVWVDRLVWTPVDKPKIPSGRTSLVTATDGASDDYVYVTWDEPQSVWTVTGYRVLRKVTGANDSTYTNLSGTVTARAFTDDSAAPGVAYTYKVEAQNAAGWGNCGTDPGYRGVYLTIDPLTHHFSNVPTDESVTVTVASNALWKAVPNDSWLHASASNGQFTVTTGDNPYAYRRSGSVTVYGGLYANGSTLPHYVTRTFSVTQSASIDIGFEYPYVDWRTRLQLTATNAVSGYAPVSVFTVDELLNISFGWRNWSDVAVELPAVKFKVFNVNNAVVLSWVDNGAGVAEGRSLAKNAKAACGFWNADNLKVLPPGDYELEAELDPEDLLDDPNRDNNKAIFRFAIRDPLLDIGKDVFFADCWTNLVVSNGNDYAQAPHVARRTVEIVTNNAPCVYEASAVQFGPYVPMDGVNGRLVEKKKPVDIVLLIDFTGSMDTCIAGLMNNIGSFIDMLMIGDSKRGISPIEDLRIKIVGFSDYRSDCTYKNWMQEYAFTTDRNLLKQQLNELKGQCYGGGGNAGESSYDALYYVCKGWSTVWDGENQPTEKTDTASPFRSTDEAARAVVLFTDEPPHLSLETPGCKGVDIYGLDSAIKAAGVNLTIIGDGFYYGNYPDYAANVHRLQDLVNLDPKTRSLKETKPYPLSSFTQDTSKLQDLAETIVLQTPSVATVVEPSFTAAVRGEGTLTFRWCNDSTADGTNNTFTFTGEGLTNIVRYGTAKPLWHDETIDYAYDGLHPLKWTYRKLGYEGSVVDCGLVTDVLWKPRATELEITPAMGTVDWLGTNEVQTVEDLDGDGNKINRPAYGVTYDVKCNSIWKVTDHSDWINLIQDSGEGDGNIVITVTTNSAYAQRTGFITVEAGEPGSAGGVTNATVHVLQNPMPFVENGQIQIVSVGVKPRWPWNDTVDIDFQVITPAKEGTPVKVWFEGVNQEGGDLLQYYPRLLAASRCNPRYNVKFRDNATGTFSDVTYNSTRKKCLVDCPTSGLYRISWQMGKDWKNVSHDTYNDVGAQAWKDENGFHTPTLSVILHAECSGCADVECPSGPVRVDMRQTSGSALTHSGGAILHGVEKVGHPNGDVDPVEVDTTDETLFPSNGWNSLNFVKALGPSYSNKYDRACVINDAYVEGGIITTTTVWRADKEHVVRDNIFVHPDARLLIEDGTIVKFCFATRIYIWRNKDRAGTEEEFNIVSKGAYWTCAFNDSVGTNTLHYTVKSGDTGEWNTDRLYFNPSKDIEWKTQIYSDASRAVMFVALERHYSDGESNYRVGPTYATKYYTVGQKWGNLPQPNEEGMEFFGWFTRPLNLCSEMYTSVGGVPKLFAEGYLNKQGVMTGGYTNSIRYLVNAANTPYEDMAKSVLYNSKNQIFALIAPKGWADEVGGSQCPPIDASSGFFSVLPENVVYDGQAQRPSISAVQLGSGALSCSPDYGEYANGFLTAGVYTVRAILPSSHANSPTNSFTILPRPVAGGEVDLSATSALYKPNWDGGVALPSVEMVRLPMGKDGELVEIPEADRAFVYANTNWYDLVQGATDYWPRPGTYHVEVKFNGNYSGTLTNEFVIEKNPEYDFTSGRFAKATAEEAVEEAKKGEGAKRILYFGGELPEDAATAYMKSLITDDIDTNEWVIANFVCWTDRADSEAFARYSAGLDEVACPLICVLNPNDLETPIVRMCGYQTKERLMDFLAASLTAPVDASAAKIAFRDGKGAFTYNDAVQKPVPGDLCITYAGAELATNQYELVFANSASEDVGTYDVWARLKPETWVGSYLVTGETAAVSYTIGAQAVWDGMPAAIRARLGIGLNPPAAVYNGAVQRPAVTSVVAYASKDYGTNDWYNIGTHTVKVTFSSNYCGTVSERFEIVGRLVVSPTVVLDRWEEYVSSKATKSLRPNVLRVYDTSRTYVENADYTVDYGDGSYTQPGTNTIKVVFCGNYSGEVRVNFVIKAVDDVVDGPTIEDDPTAVVTGDAETGFVITPSTGKSEITVTIPTGVSPSKVTVKLSPTVKVVRPNGATLRIERRDGDNVYSYDVNENLNVTTNAEKEVDLEHATVKDEVVKEMFDAKKGGGVNLDPSSPSLSVATREGLLYSFREGTTLEALKADAPETHVGDGKPWTDMKINVKGGASGFYGVGVEK